MVFEDKNNSSNLAKSSSYRNEWANNLIKCENMAEDQADLVTDFVDVSQSVTALDNPLKHNSDFTSYLISEGILKCEDIVKEENVIQSIDVCSEYYPEFINVAGENVIKEEALAFGNPMFDSLDPNSLSCDYFTSVKEIRKQIGHGSMEESDVVEQVITDPLSTVIPDESSSNNFSNTGVGDRKSATKEKIKNLIFIRKEIPGFISMTQNVNCENTSPIKTQVNRTFNISKSSLEPVGIPANSDVVSRNSLSRNALLLQNGNIMLTFGTFKQTSRVPPPRVICLKPAINYPIINKDIKRKADNKERGITKMFRSQLQQQSQKFEKSGSHLLQNDVRTLQKEAATSNLLEETCGARNQVVEQFLNGKPVKSKACFEDPNRIHETPELTSDCTSTLEEFNGIMECTVSSSDKASESEDFKAFCSVLEDIKKKVKFSEEPNTWDCVNTFINNYRQITVDDDSLKSALRAWGKQEIPPDLLKGI